MLLALNPPPDPAQAIPADQFSNDEKRIGLDHLSLSVASMADLQAAVALFNARGIAHRRDQAAGAVWHRGAGVS